MPQLHKRLHQLKSNLWSELPGENWQLQERAREVETGRTGRGRGGKQRIRRGEKNKERKPQGDENRDAFCGNNQQKVPKSPGLLD